MRRRELLKAAAAAVVLGVGYASKAAARVRAKLTTNSTNETAVMACDRRRLGDS
jgi:hypothetical protein